MMVKKIAVILVLLFCCLFVAGCVTVNDSQPQIIKTGPNTYSGEWSSAVNTSSYYLIMNLNEDTKEYSWKIYVKDADGFNKIYQNITDDRYSTGDTIEGYGLIIAPINGVYELKCNRVTVRDNDNIILVSNDVTGADLGKTTFTYDNVTDTVTVTDDYSTVRYKRIN